MENNNQAPLGILSQLFSGRVWAGNRSVIPMGYVAIFIFFAFSFCNFKCNVDHVGASTGSVTGYELVMGKYVKANPLLQGAGERDIKKLIEPIYKTYEDEKGVEVEAMEIPANNWARLSLLTAILGLLLFMFVYESYKGHIALVTGSIGVVFMVLLNSSLSNLVNEKFGYILKADFTFAYWLATITFGIIAVMGYYRLKYTQIETTAIDGTVTLSAPQPLNFEEFIRDNKWVVLAVVLVLGSSIIFYKSYYKKDYSDEIKELAVKACNCDIEKLEKEQKNVNTFLGKIKTAKPEDTDRLRNDFNIASNKISKDYGKCNNSIRHKFEDLSKLAVNTGSYQTEEDVNKKYSGYYETLHDSLVDEDKYRKSDDFFRALDSLSRSGNDFMYPPPPMVIEED